jgi:hemolysin activation/secretion protein
VVPELDWLSGAGRVYWNGVSSANAPFYLQSGLGGPFLLRGFTEGRFVDRFAWMVEVEQRVRLYQTNLFGVKTDWRLDPFVTAGQVYGSLSDMWDHPRVAGGIGLRAFVHPSVVGRIDLAYGGEGIKTYVEIGYPY